MWDYQIEDEELPEKRARLAEAKRLCGTCPLQLACLAFHDELTVEAGERVAGVWGGRVVADRVGSMQNKDAPAEMFEVAFNTKVTSAARAIDRIPAAA